MWRRWVAKAGRLERNDFECVTSRSIFCEHGFQANASRLLRRKLRDQFQLLSPSACRSGDATRSRRDVGRSHAIIKGSRGGGDRQERSTVQLRSRRAIPRNGSVGWVAPTGPAAGRPDDKLRDTNHHQHPRPMGFASAQPILRPVECRTVQVAIEDEVFETRDPRQPRRSLHVAMQAVGLVMATVQQ
jgi:hypothetical protein